MGVAMASEHAGVRATPRDLELVRWLGEMYGAPITTFGRLIDRLGEGVAPENQPVLARYHAARLERLGYVQRRRLLNHQWVLPTRRGLQSAGLRFEPWQPQDWKLEHVAMTGRARLYLQAAYPGSGWESERSIKHRWRQQRIRGLRAPDGLLLLPSGAQIAVEVERYRKPRDKYVRLVRELSTEVDEVLWLVPPADVDWLQVLVTEAAASTGIRHVVEAIPEAVMAP
jgi:hypothetical protein